jgi:hypothetical protein
MLAVMTDGKNGPPPPRDLRGALAELRARAEKLPDEHRDAALEHVDQLDEHARSHPPDTLRMRVLLKGLEAFGDLVPYISAAANALSNVGA